MCIANGFPTVPFLADEDLTRSDGVIVCRRLSVEEVLRWGWRLSRAVKFILEHPIEF